MSIEEEIEMLEGEFCELKHEEQSDDVTHRMQELAKKCKQALKNLKCDSTELTRLRADYLAACRTRIDTVQQKAWDYLNHLDRDLDEEIRIVFED